MVFQLLANKMKFDAYGYAVSYQTNYTIWKDTPASEYNTDTFYSSLIITFQILTGEDWNAAYYAAYRAHGRCTKLTCVV